MATSKFAISKKRRSNTLLETARIGLSQTLFSPPVEQDLEVAFAALHRGTLWASNLLSLKCRANLSRPLSTCPLAFDRGALGQEARLCERR
jgi:hypothetical protein